MTRATSDIPVHGLVHTHAHLGLDQLYGDVVGVVRPAPRVSSAFRVESVVVDVPADILQALENILAEFCLVIVTQ